MPTLAFARSFRYAELTSLLKAFVAEHPGLVSVESIGKSHEGRDIWVLTETSAADTRAGKQKGPGPILQRARNSSLPPL